MANEQIVEEELEVNMTPMLDIVFIMLIFFIVTAVFVKESGVDVTRPESSQASEVKRLSSIIGVTEDNQIWINKKQVELAEVNAVVTKLKQENPKGKVVITADDRSDSGLVVAIIQTLNEMGVEGVAIATRAGGAQ